MPMPDNPSTAATKVKNTLKLLHIESAAIQRIANTGGADSPTSQIWGNLTIDSDQLDQRFGGMGSTSQAPASR